MYLDILEAGIDVISAINIQHIESINEDVKQITGVEVTERVPDKILQLADEVVNIDLTADELITRLKEGKIYDHSKVQQALTNFFQAGKDFATPGTGFKRSSRTSRKKSGP